MFAVVNGYPCSSSCDVAVARKNIDPRNPRNDPAKAEQLAEADRLKGKSPKADGAAGPSDPARVNGAADSAPPRLDRHRLVDLYA